MLFLEYEHVPVFVDHFNTVGPPLPESPITLHSHKSWRGASPTLITEPQSNEQRCDVV